MLAGQTMVDENNVQVALFPLRGFSISQPWYGSFSHDGSRYYATDFLGKDENGNRVYRAPCYAPVDIKLLWKDPVQCGALWQSVNKVHFADGSVDYLGIIVYHDNDIQTGNYANIGDVVTQGNIFNRTGTGGNVTGDHVHLETGKGEVNLSQSRYHFYDTTDCKRIVPDKALFVNDTYVTPYSRYEWIEYVGGITPPTPPTPVSFKKSKFPWTIYARKLRMKNFFKNI